MVIKHSLCPDNVPDIKQRKGSGITVKVVNA